MNQPTEHVVVYQGAPYATGLLPRSKNPGEAAPMYKPAAIRRLSELPAMQDIYYLLQPPLVNQGQYPACTCASFANVLRFLLARKNRQVVEFDWYSAWVALTGGRGGAALQDMWQLAQTKGMPIKGTNETLVVTEMAECADATDLVSGMEEGGIGHLGTDMFGGGHAVTALWWDGSKLKMENSWGDYNGQQGHFDMSTGQVGFNTYGAGVVFEMEIRPIDRQTYPDIS